MKKEEKLRTAHKLDQQYQQHFDAKWNFLMKMPMVGLPIYILTYFLRVHSVKFIAVFIRK